MHRDYGACKEIDYNMKAAFFMPCRDTFTLGINHVNEGMYKCSVTV